MADGLRLGGIERRGRKARPLWAYAFSLCMALLVQAAPMLGVATGASLSEAQEEGYLFGVEKVGSSTPLRKRVDP